jgi:hypothetical protein
LDRVFLDANVLYAAAYWDGSPLRRLWQLLGVELWTCDYAAAEALGNLSEDRPGRVDELQRLIGLMRSPRRPTEEGGPPPGMELPAKDRPILAAAIRAQAHYLLTGDKTHFGPYFGQIVGGVRILPPSQYLALRR